MAPTIHIELDALCLLLLCTIVYQSHKSVNQQMDRILFRKTAYGNIVLLILDILWVLIEGHQFPGAVTANRLINAFYLGGGVVVGCLWYLYVLETLGYTITRRLQTIVMLPGLFFLILNGYKDVIASGCDIVLLCAPPVFRPRHLAACVAAGKHIFAEKPIATDPRGLRAFLKSVADAKAKNLSILSGTLHRHSNRFLKQIGPVRNGCIGKIMAGRVYRCHGPIWVRPRRGTAASARSWRAASTAATGRSGCVRAVAPTRTPATSATTGTTSGR